MANENDLLSGDNLLNQIVNISKAGAYDILAEQVKELQAENARLKRNQESTILLAIEFGYKQCEKGNNLEMAFLNYKNL